MYTRKTLIYVWVWEYFIYIELVKILLYDLMSPDVKWNMIGRSWRGLELIHIEVNGQDYISYFTHHTMDMIDYSY